MNMTSANPKQTAMDYTTTSNLLISRLSKSGGRKSAKRLNKSAKRLNKSTKYKKSTKQKSTFQMTNDFTKYSNYKKFQSIRNLKNIRFIKQKGGATAPNIPYAHLSPNGGGLQTTGNDLAVSKNLAVAQSQYDNTAILKK